VTSGDKLRKEADIDEQGTSVREGVEGRTEGRRKAKLKGSQRNN
jgi:hypothetical protein